MTAAPTRRGGKWRELVVAATVIATIVVIAAVIQSRTSRWPRTTCAANESDLVRCYRDTVEKGRLDPTLHGSAQILSWFGDAGLPLGREMLLMCPGDPDFRLPEVEEDRLPFHPVGAAALRATRGISSYAVRDFEHFPVDPTSTEKQAILCDRQGADGRKAHHKDVILVAFAEGDVQKLSREELGVAPGDPIVVGPDSPSPLLRVFEQP